MAPGFLLFVAVVFFAALSPLVLALAFGFLFFASTRSYSSRLVAWGIAGGAFLISGQLVLQLTMAKHVQLSWSEHFAVFCAGFTFFSVTGTLAQVLRRKWKLR